MYYRRKILLALIEAFGGKLSNTYFQKILFLYSLGQEKPSYEFVPYSFGPFSFQSYADRRTLIKYNILENTPHGWYFTGTHNYIDELTIKDKELIFEIRNKYKSFSLNKVLRHVYKEYPYYAIKSSIKEKILGTDAVSDTEKRELISSKSGLFTIGYEGNSIEKYLNKLILNDIKILIDVRRNPISMKYGFSKNQLKNYCNRLNILYLHFPQLGIESSKRTSLKTQDDYDLLFKEYENCMLPQNIDKLEEIIKLVNMHNSVAITCFEAFHGQCHRGKISQTISTMPNCNFEVNHI
ncbi:MAG: DUF488 family protein [Ignavibacteria bacterium]|nr:DUF488 family protein [Ignavibacteria bacterium]